MRQEQGGLEHFFWIGFHRLLSHTCFQGNGNRSGSLIIFPLCSSRCLQTPVGFAHAEALFAERGCWSRELRARSTRSSVVICPLLVILLQVLLGGRDRGMAGLSVVTGTEQAHHGDRMKVVQKDRTCRALHCVRCLGSVPRHTVGGQEVRVRRWVRCAGIPVLMLSDVRS